MDAKDIFDSILLPKEERDKQPVSLFAYKIEKSRTAEPTPLTLDMLRDAMKPRSSLQPTIAMSKQLYEEFRYTDLWLYMLYGFVIRDNVLVSGWAY